MPDQDREQLAGMLAREMRRERNSFSDESEDYHISDYAIYRFASAIASILPPTTSAGDGELVERLPVSGWASPSLGRAYNEVDQLRLKLAQPVESGIDEALKLALDAIEAADVELEGIAC